MRGISPEDFSFVPHLRPGDRIVAGQATAEPRSLVRRLLEEARAGLLPPVSLFVGPVYSDSFFGGVPEGLTVESNGAIRSASALARAGRLTVYPAHLLALERDIRAGWFRVDMALFPLQEVPGGLHLGMARDYTYSAARRARMVIGELQPQMPVCPGGELDPPLPLGALVRAETGVVELPLPVVDTTTAAIARRVAGVVPDGAVLQMGVGTIPAAVCDALTGHRDLGVHSGAVGDGIVDLAESGALTNARKERDRGGERCGNPDGHKTALRVFRWEPGAAVGGAGGNPCVGGDRRPVAVPCDQLGA
tara:strand:- start:79 stop:996 length:918 start_codon:yes stop_codon:yes gene_type:complete